ncbi:MAG: hypothetical protein JWO94_3616 [Verrucomicrobiaceae bacterium]|nr:hypothetical protein [Verrucomicrobiaceae bacterium]
MPALLEHPAQSPGFQSHPLYASPPLSSGMPGPLTSGLAAVFGDAGLGSRTDPSRALSPFGSAPLRHPTQGFVTEVHTDPAFRQPSQPMPAPMPVQQPAWTSPMAMAQDPAFRSPAPQAFPYPAPQAYANPPTGSMGGVSANALISALEQKQQGMEPEPSSLETLRMQMFGRYHEEVEGRMKELRSAMDGTVTRSRRALMERMDELGAGLHRDMVAMRQEMQKELEDLKRDVFSAVMSISALNDKLGLTDSRFRETWMAVTKALTDRIDNQAAGLATSMKGMDARIDQMVEERVDGLVEKAMLRQVSIWRARQTGATAASAMPVAAA